MARSDRFDPLLAVVAGIIVSLSINLALRPLPFLTRQARLAVHLNYRLPAAPAWPVGRPARINPELSLSKVAG